MSESIDVLGEAVGIERLDGLDDPGVEGAPPVLEQAAVRHLVGQGVLEGVLEVGKEASLVEKLAGLEGRETVPQDVLGNLRDRLEDRKGHILADDRGRLEEALRFGREPVDPRGQDRLASWASGAPKRAMIPSPRTWFTVPS